MSRRCALVLPRPSSKPLGVWWSKRSVPVREPLVISVSGRTSTMLIVLPCAPTFCPSLVSPGVVVVPFSVAMGTTWGAMMSIRVSRASTFSLIPYTIFIMEGITMVIPMRPTGGSERGTTVGRDISTTEAIGVVVLIISPIRPTGSRRATTTIGRVIILIGVPRVTVLLLVPPTPITGPPGRRALVMTLPTMPWGGTSPGLVLALRRVIPLSPMMCSIYPSVSRRGTPSPVVLTL